jgi:GNAT superfamily N-acetyltransferase
VQIENVADHLHLIDIIALWHFREWGHVDPTGSVQSWADGLRQETNRGRVPTTFVALEGDELLGSVTLTDHDMTSHLDLTPWLAGLYVKPEKRRLGVGTVLVRHAVQAAAEMGIHRLYLYTESARDLYQRLGWQVIVEDFYEGQAVTIMSFDISSRG